MPFGSAPDADGHCMSCASDLAREQDRQRSTDLARLRDAATQTPTGGKFIRHASLTFRDSKRLSRIVIVLLVAGMLFNVLGILSSGMQITLLKTIASGEQVTKATLIANDARQGGIAFLNLMIYVAKAVAFCFWIYRASANLLYLRAFNQKNSPAWAVGGFFIPFLNLILPYKVMKEICIGSDPHRGDIDLSSEATSAPSLIGWWWLTWIASNIWSAFAYRMPSQGSTIQHAIDATWEQIRAQAFALIPAMLCILLVKEIVTRQTRRAHDMSDLAQMTYVLMRV